MYVTQMYSFFKYNIQSKSCCDKLEIWSFWTRPNKNGIMKLRKTIKGDIGYLKVNWTNTAQTSLYWTTGNNNDYINEYMYGKLKYIPLHFP